jgi:aryl-alcohol dehydrogenase-like predicted oxidoreductase
MGVDTIRRAHAVHPLSDLQIEYSLISRAPEARIFPALAELGVGVTGYGVLSRGLLSGSAERRFPRRSSVQRRELQANQAVGRASRRRNG